MGQQSCIVPISFIYVVHCIWFTTSHNDYHWWPEAGTLHLRYLRQGFTHTQRSRSGSKVQFPHDDQRLVFAVARRRVKYRNAPVWLVSFSDVMGYSISELISWEKYGKIKIDTSFISIEMYDALHTIYQNNDVFFLIVRCHLMGSLVFELSNLLSGRCMFWSQIHMVPIRHC